MSRFVSRDPFARFTVRSHRVYPAGLEPQGCDWCGSLRHTASEGRAWLLRFTIEPDSGRDYTDSHAFCSRSCYTSYHG